VKDQAQAAALTVSPSLQQELTRLCAYYLVRAKEGGWPLDPVARFHLANGAYLECLNWLADTSDSGIQRSLGLMANYVYRLRSVERNHDSFARERRIFASRPIARLAAQSQISDAYGDR
jgi:malonyl-CoA decarboxylase